MAWDDFIWSTPDVDWSNVGDKILSAVSNPSVISAGLTAGAGLFSGLQQIDANKQAQQLTAEQQKLNQLLEVAKLRYGPQPTRNKNQDIIDAMKSGQDDKLNALGRLQYGIMGALR